MTGRAASGAAGLRARRGLMLAAPIALVALVVAAFAPAPTGISHGASDRTGERLLPPVSRASMPAQAILARPAITGPAVPSGEPTPSRSSRAAKRLEWLSVRRLFLIALALTIVLPLVAVLLAFAAVSSQAQCAGGLVGSGSVPGVPSGLLAVFERAAGSYQLGPGGWAYLAAINSIESDFARSTLPGVHSGTNADGAAGPMQIGIEGPAGDTWARYEVDAPGGSIPPRV